MITKLALGGTSGIAYPAVIESFICDICGLPGERTAKGQKRHEGKCREEYQRGLHSGAVKRTWLRARQLRRRG